jgi:two-component system, cell cycle sensor histidine kinase and response regulator CckA
MVSKAAPPELVAMLLERANEVCYQVRIDDAPCHGVMTFVSRQCHDLTGCSPEQFEASPHRWFDLVHPEDRQTLVSRTREILASGREGTRLYRIRDAEGRYRHVEDRVMPMLNARGRAVGYQGIAQDITERVHAEEQQRRALNALKNAERGEALGRLAAGTAHDFNNILTVVLGFSESVRAQLSHEHPATMDLCEIDAAVARGARMVKQLLAFSRRQAVEPQVIHLSTHVGALDALLRQMVPDDVDLQLVLDRSTWPVFIDPSQVDQIVLNLVANARDAMPDGGLLEIMVANVELTPAFCETHAGAVAGDYVCLRVRDTGVGMPREVVQHAFVPFFSTKPEGQGTGIGLASVFGIVKQNLGYVCIESEVGVGTVVSVYLRRHRIDA